ncbi:dUTP diphosphatase, partial [Aerococcus mictus]
MRITKEPLKLKVKRLTDTAKLPEKAHASDAGLDIFADEYITITKSFSETVSTGIAVDIPKGYYGRLKGRSGLTSKTGLRVQEGTIDSGYTGEIKVMCDFKDNLTPGQYTPGYLIRRGDKIAQLIIQPLPEIE